METMQPDPSNYRSGHDWPLMAWQQDLKCKITDNKDD